jgi:hypothetical protein
MNPLNRLRVQEALLSVLAGDIFRGTPFRMRLIFFKALYYFYSVANLKQSLLAWRQRRRAIRDSGDAARP